MLSNQSSNQLSSNQPASQQHFSGTLHPSQIKGHWPIAFEVPSGTTRLELHFTYAPHRVEDAANLITLTLFDSVEFRGEGHKMEPEQQIILSASEVTPGYLAGALPAGTYNVVMNTHMLLAPVDYQLTLSLSAITESAEAIHYQKPHLPIRGQGWYRGDFHAHTIHSDADWDVPDLIAYSRAQGLDFMSLTDHNTTSGLAQLESLATNDLAMMGGFELTTFYGHAVAWGVREWIDWRTGSNAPDSKRTITDAIRDVDTQGGMFIIAHPMSPGDPYCTGCDWQYPDVMRGIARLVEVWNGSWDGDSGNEEALQLWYKWLNQGFRMIATAGSDIHGDTEPINGRDVVFADELTEAMIVRAVKAGHLFLSSAPHLELTATARSIMNSVMMGDTVPGSQADLTVSWHSVPDQGATVRWIVDGETRSTLPADESGTNLLHIDAAHWCVVELRAANGVMLAVTNPIFFGDEWR